jgi:mannose-1-phosphate guanylyltransferase/mannose-6-phosphate isomerase
VILSGGSGTRLWPLSRRSMPKQFLPLLGPESPLQATLARLQGMPDSERPILVTGTEHRFIVAEQLRMSGVAPHSILLEPEGRNTGPAIAAAALSVLSEDPDAHLLVLPADHHVSDLEAFHSAVSSGMDASAAGYFSIFGIPPLWPEPGYGYVRRGTGIEGLPGCHRVDQFIEKPEAEIAARLCESGEYLWNSGMFVLPAALVVAELESLQPLLVASCRQAVANAKHEGDFVRLDAAAFARCPPVSIDHALMEHTGRAAMVRADFAWSDIGSWKALWETQDHDKSGNVVAGDVHTDGARNCYIHSSSRMLVGIGIEDLVIVETPDAVLVTGRDEVHRVGPLIERLRERGRSECTTHRTVYRPWGTYEDIDSGHRFRVKRITVTPGGKLSLQIHHHRAEHWVVVSGTARVTRGEEVLLLTENQSTYIPVGTAHRLENPGRIPLQIVEVQSGAYVGEDDIVRIEDVYSRL